MKSTLITCAVALGLLLAPPQAIISQAAAQSSLPSLGDDTSLTLGAERRMGDHIVREIYRDPEYVSDPLLDAYMARIMQPLYAAAKRRGELPPEMSEQFAWRLFLVRDKSVNAFALPGGYFGVHLGLLALVDTPDELASVMAHEITHVTQRHIARGMSKQSAAMPWVIAGILVGLLAARTNGHVANAAIATAQGGAAQNQLNFTRDMEREADRIGYTLMQPAGYAPSGFVAMFNKLAFASRLADNGSFPYLRSHPLTSDRIADMTNRVGEFEAHAHAKTVTTANASTLQLHRLMAARAKALSDLSLDAQRFLVTRAKTLEGVQSTHMATLYAGVLASKQLKDTASAEALYAQLQRLVSGGAASGLSAPDEVQQLIRLLGAEVNINANGITLQLESDNRAEMLLAAQQAINSGQVKPQEAAATRLRHWTSSNPQDAAAWSLLSSAYVAQNQRVRAAIAEAESQRAKLDHSAALASYQAAQSLIRQGLQADSIDSAIVDSKVRELQLRVRERLP
jgi:predicted Zn-dependent protease